MTRVCRSAFARFSAALLLASCTSTYTVSASGVLRAREAVARGAPREPIRAEHEGQAVYLPAELIRNDAIQSPMDRESLLELPDPRVSLRAWGFTVLSLTGVSTITLISASADAESMAGFVGVPAAISLVLILTGYLAAGPEEIDGPTWGPGERL